MGIKFSKARFLNHYYSDQGTKLKQPLELTLIPKRVVFILGALVLFFLLAHIATTFIWKAYNSNLTLWLAILFNLDKESNVPTLFCILLFILNSVLFGLIWKSQSPSARGRSVWLVLSIVFVFLALDEFASIHERIVWPVVTSMISTSGLFHFSWIIPYSVALLFLAIFVLPIIWRLPKSIRLWMFMSAGVFLSGALGFEMLEGLYRQQRFTYFVLMTIEETLEMAGLAILVYPLLLLIHADRSALTIHIRSNKTKSE